MLWWGNVSAWALIQATYDGSSIYSIYFITLPVIFTITFNNQQFYFYASQHKLYYQKLYWTNQRLRCIINRRHKTYGQKLKQMGNSKHYSVLKKEQLDSFCYYSFGMNPYTFESSQISYSEFLILLLILIMKKDS